MADKKKFEQTLHVVFFLFPFLTSKQISIEVLIVFQDRYPRTITIQLTSKNLIISFLENNRLR